jgi:hypothetical protein
MGQKFDGVHGQCKRASRPGITLLHQSKSSLWFLHEIIDIDINFYSL